MTSPSLITTTQSLMVRTTSMSCSTKSTVSPSSRNCSTWPMIVCASAGFTPAIGSPSIRSRGCAIRAQPHVVDDGEPGERLGELERADHAQAGDAVRRQAGERGAVERPAAGVGLVEPREQVEEGGLARAVGADQ